ncbi:MAG: AIR synthase related protein, partial [Chloroflexota bacterium]|nr:AIR synthase related protein [Chloroflexota bacterium]
MIRYQIEVRAIAVQHDVRTQQLAREIQQLPLTTLPSLAAISASPAPLFIRTAQLYYLAGDCARSQVERLTRELLSDPVVQVARISKTEHERPHEHSPEGNAFPAHIIDVLFHPGVTDTLAESIHLGTALLGLPALEQVTTGQRYILDGRFSETDARAITQALLYNPVIQHYHLYPAYPHTENGEAPPAADAFATDTPQSIDASPSPTVSVAISAMTDKQLLALSKRGMLALNLDEMHAIQDYYRREGREPSTVELETLAQTWSEHCSHKTFKATIVYRELDSQGHVLMEETIHNLLKSYIMRATEQVQRPWVVSAFSDNAGIIRFNETQDIAFKVETHNHPSAIEPFGGANTGIGGVIRDVMGVSAQPIAGTDILCFGPPATAADTLPAGVLPPRRIASGVVSGVRDYSNKMGIPTVNGAVLYHEGYLYNPLVFCGCLGILPRESHPSQAQPGDRIVVLGGRTGRDGIHGATFSSGEMSREINAQAGSAVQIGAPITEKKVADVIVQARDRRLYHAITDCGAGGFSSAIGEMGAETGARVELSQAPLKYQGLAAWEIWLSEAQERMVLAIPPTCLPDLLAICAIEEVEASIIGAFTSDHRLTVLYHEQVVADLSMEFLHDGRPERILEAVWTEQFRVGAPLHTQAGRTHYRRARGAEGAPLHENHAEILLALLRHPTIASKEAIVRRYDHEVQGATVLKPLVGRAGNGPGDAAVLQPILDPAVDEQTGAGIVLSNGINPLYSALDPYHMALNAVDEALRNLTAVGGDIERTAILDNFCWGSPTDPAQLGMLVRAVKGCHDAAVGFGTPFISGKDSLNNEYRVAGQRLPVIP